MDDINKAKFCGLEKSLPVKWWNILMPASSLTKNVGLVILTSHFFFVDQLGTCFINKPSKMLEAMLHNCS